MILGVLLGFAALAAVLSLLGQRGDDSSDSKADKDARQTTGSNNTKLVRVRLSDDPTFGPVGENGLNGQNGDNTSFGEDDGRPSGR